MRLTRTRTLAQVRILSEKIRQLSDERNQLQARTDPTARRDATRRAPSTARREHCT